MFSFFRRSSHKEAGDKALAAGPSAESGRSAADRDRCNKSHKNDKKNKKLSIISRTESPRAAKKNPNDSPTLSKMSDAADSTPADPPLSPLLIVSPALPADHVTDEGDDPCTPPPITAERFTELLKMCRDITSPDRCDPLEIPLPSSPDSQSIPAGSDPPPSDQPVGPLESLRSPEDNDPVADPPTPPTDSIECCGADVCPPVKPEDDDAVAAGDPVVGESLSDSNEPTGDASKNSAPSPTLSDPTLRVESLDVTSPTLSPDSAALDDQLSDPSSSPIPIQSPPEEAGEEERPVADGTMAALPAAMATVAPPAPTSADASASEGHSIDEKIRQLEMQLLEKSKRLDDLEAAILEDDERLGKLESIERLEMELKERDLYDNEREEELRLLSDALEEALEEKAELEMAAARNSSRETQLLEDFEWKLREIERDYKKRMMDAEKATEERVRSQMAAEWQKLVDDKKGVDEKLNEIALLKSHEAEAIQLRGLVNEQQRALRGAARQIEQIRASERVLQEDVHRLRTQGCTRQQQQDVEQKWQDKLRAECQTLRQELTARFEQEKALIQQQAAADRDQQVEALRAQFEAEKRLLLQQVTDLRKTMADREHELLRQMESARTHADRQLCDLRRELDKAYDANSEALEKLERKHTEELDKCKLALLASMEAEYDEKLRYLESQHQTQLNALQNLIEEEKQDALTQLGDHYRTQMESLNDHIQTLQKRMEQTDLRDEVSRLNRLVTQKDDELNDLRQELETIRNQSRPASSGVRSSGGSQKSGSTASTSSTASSHSVTSNEETSSSGGSEEDAARGTPLPIGRSAGDGCSPATSVAGDVHRVHDDDVHAAICDPRLLMSPGSMSAADECPAFPLMQHALDSVICCNDPDHYEAQQMLMELQQILADRDAELQRLTEEKRFYQLELIHWERNLAQPRGGLPLSLMPDVMSTDGLPAGCYAVWRGFSAPPITKPRLAQLANAGCPSGPTISSANSYESQIYSPANKISPDPYANIPVARLPPTYTQQPDDHCTDGEEEEEEEEDDEDVEEEDDEDDVVDEVDESDEDDDEEEEEEDEDEEDEDEEVDGSGFTTPLPDHL